MSRRPSDPSGDLDATAMRSNVALPGANASFGRDAGYRRVACGEAVSRQFHRVAIVMLAFLANGVFTRCQRAAFCDMVRERSFNPQSLEPMKRTHPAPGKIMVHGRRAGEVTDVDIKQR